MSEKFEKCEECKNVKKCGKVWKVTEKGPFRIGTKVFSAPPPLATILVTLH